MSRLASSVSFRERSADRTICRWCSCFEGRRGGKPSVVNRTYPPGIDPIHGRLLLCPVDGSNHLGIERSEITTIDGFRDVDPGTRYRHLPASVVRAGNPSSHDVALVYVEI